MRETINVFLSHSKRDAELARLLGKLIGRSTQGQMECWYSSDDGVGGGIGPGDEWHKELRDRLGRSHALVVVLTRNAAASAWVNYEVGMATARSIPVVPFALERDCLINTEPLSFHQAVDFESERGSLRFVSRFLNRFKIHYDSEAYDAIREAVDKEIWSYLAQSKDDEKYVKVKN